MVKKSAKILTCKEEIKTFMGGIGNHLFKKYISLGMPARLEGRDWIAHTENLEEWFKHFTRVRASEFIKDKDSKPGKR